MIFESKFSTPRQLRNIVLARLNCYSAPAPSFANSTIKTQYYDDIASTSFLEAKDGQMDKRKYRLREYILSEPGGARYSIEVKKRQGAKTMKVKRLVNGLLPCNCRPSTFKELIGELERLGGITLNEIRHELPDRELYPSAAVYYERARFEDQRRNARYNLDTSIRVSPGLSAEGVYLDFDILEIKSQDPELFPEFFYGLGVKRMSFSKFVWARELLSA